MTDVQVIIVTALVNFIVTGLISGIVVYYIQQNINASIQKSIFEYQTKYSRSYPKTIGILESFNQKFVDYRNSIERSLFFLRHPYIENKINVDDFFDVDIDSVNTINDLKHLVENNRFYLADDTVTELNDVISGLYEINTKLIVFNILSKQPKEKLVKWLREENLSGSLPNFDCEEDQLQLEYGSYFEKKLMKYVERVESHYKRLVQLRD